MVAACKEVKRPDAVTSSAPRTTLYAVMEEEAHITKWLNEIEEIAAMNLKVMDSVKDLYEPFKFLLTKEPRAKVFDENDDKTVEQYREYVTGLRQKQTELAMAIP